jgi:hypothetical protein
MISSLSEWIDLYVFPMGRRERALRLVMNIAAERGWEELRARCEAAVAHEQDLRKLNRAFLRDKNKPVNPELTKLDPKIDRTVGAIYRGAKEAVITLAGTPAAEAGQLILDELFPGGAAAITHLDYIEQSTEVGSIITELTGSLKDAVEATALTLFVRQLVSFNAEFQSILDAEKAEGVTSDKVRAAFNQGQENLLEAVAMILGRYPKSTDEHISARQQLLKPVGEQQDAIAAYHAARRSVGDIDPQTGEEVAGDEVTGESTPTPEEVPTEGHE